VADFTLLDGGCGRELARVGAPFRQPEWSALALLDAPQFVTRVHESYVAAGADVITANSYAVVPFHIGEARFAARGLELADRAGRLARDVGDRAARGVRIAGSLPPVCGSYRADLFDPVKARPVLETLVAGLRPHVDIWLAETLSTLEEAQLARDVIGDDARPLWLSFTLRDDAEPHAPPRLRSGASVADALGAAVRLGASAVLFNCSQPEVMAGAIGVARAFGAILATGAYANAFPPQRPGATANDGLDDLREDLTPQGYLAFARAWRALGADIIGGCCGIGPEHIAALRAGLAP